MTEFIASLRDASRIADALSNLFYRFPGLKHILTKYIRYGMCALAVMTVASCVASLLREKYLPEQWGVLRTESGDSFLLSHWENILGRARPKARSSSSSTRFIRWWEPAAAREPWMQLTS